MKISAYILIGLLLIAYVPLSSQIFDDFSDGDFSYNPSWGGDTSDFKITNSGAFPSEMKPGLQLNSSGSDTSIIFLPNSLINNTEWQFWVKLSFNTSANNYLRVYLTSDQQDFKNELNGYFLQVGGENDSLTLYKQSGYDVVKLISGSLAFTGNSSNILRIKVTNENGLWSLFSNTGGSYDFQSEGQAFDNTFNSSDFFGIYCKYTSSNATKFYFDGVSIGEIIIDTEPPEILFVNASSSTILDLQFNEYVFAISAQNVLNYVLEGENENPKSALRDETDLSLVHLEFESGFIPETKYFIITSGIADLSDNIMKPDTAYFIYHEPYLAGRSDIIFSEIMCDQNPAPNNLPEADYLELFNRTKYQINLQNYTLQTGESSKPVIIPEILIEADSFLIIVKNTNVYEFNQYGQVAGLSGFYLSNEGTVLLRNPHGVLIDVIKFTKTFYKDEEKQEGGWALELIDPDQPCLGELNWSASANVDGGTPGKLNSVYNKMPSNPIITDVNTNDNNVIRIKFNHIMDSISLLNPNAYFVDQGIGNPVFIAVNDIMNNSVVLEFPNEIVKNRIYNLSISDTIFDCTGEYIEMNSTFEGPVPIEAKQYDIVINEILFNPADEGVDFVEIYNNSNKIADCKNLRLGSVKVNQFETNDSIFKIVSVENRLILPGQYLVLTKNPEKVMQQYWTNNQQGFVNVDVMPAFGNESGTVILENESGEIIDVFNYDENMHHPLLNSLEGVSLERINFDRYSHDETNWHSAAETVGFATPAYQNSQYNELTVDNSPVVLEPEIFSPDNDGYNDILNIHYKFESSGLTANITIYDAKGRLIEYLVRNTLLGTEGVFSWDGRTDSHQKAEIGIYIIYFETFDIKGNVKKYKKPAVLGGKL